MRSCVEDVNYNTFVVNVGILVLRANAVNPAFHPDYIDLKITA